MFECRIRNFAVSSVALALAGTFTPIGAMAAQPADMGRTTLAPSIVAGSSMNASPNMATVQPAQYRRGYRFRRGPGYRRYRGGRRWRNGRWIGPAIGAGIAALIIGNSIAESRRRYRNRWEECDDRYNSFRWSDGTYQPYGGGPRRLCPYLRR